MTISVTISVNGNYKCPVSYKQGDREENHVVSGRGMDRPNELSIPFYHSADVMTLSIGPEERDDGDNESRELRGGKPGAQPLDGGAGDPPPPPPPPPPPSPPGVGEG